MTSLPSPIAVSRFVHQYIQDVGWPPTRREIASEFKISLSSAQDVVGQAEKLGVLEIGRGARQIKVLMRESQMKKMENRLDQF